MSWTALLQALPYVAQIGGAVLPFLSQLTSGGSQNGSSSNAMSQSSQTQTSTSQNQSGTSQSVTQGSPQGIAGLMQSAVSTPTGSNWKDAFSSSQSSATTANNLQTGQWTLANAMNAFGNLMQTRNSWLSLTSARDYNTKQAAESRAWTRKMRRTAYQDTVEDLKKAGLNPILAASRGATSGETGASASTTAGNFSSLTSAAVPSAHAASAQAMYDYGNNTMQFMDYAMKNISNAKQLGMTSFANQMYSMAESIMEGSMASSSEYANETIQQAKKDIRDDIIKDDLFHSNPESGKMLDKKLEAAKEKGKNAKQTPQTPFQHIRG